MQFYDVIENRKSIKKFKSTELCEEKLSRIINAAMMSPSWKNNTCYKFVLVKDKNEREQIAKAIINSNDDASISIEEAPMVAVVVADPNDSGEVKDKEMYMVDSAIAMEHLVLAATAEGYGTCWIAAIDEKKIRNILNIPENFKVIALTPIGEIAENVEHHKKKHVSEHVYVNTWNKPFSENIKTTME